jgi:hypothetical protein
LRRTCVGGTKKVAFADKSTASRGPANKDPRGERWKPFFHQSLVFLSEVSYLVISKEEVYWGNRHGHNFSTVFSLGDGVVNILHTQVLCSPAFFRVECQDHTLDASSIFPT